MYITSAACISHQNSFRNKGFHSSVKTLSIDSELITPDYKNIISPIIRRRMSDAVKMAIACSLECIQEAGIKTPEAIIVGTSLGSNFQTKKFLDIIIEADGGILSPTPFSLSTANTIAGQISLLLGTNGYNTTHTQNSLSFEHALLDGILCVEEELDHVLVGGVDESEELLYNYAANLDVIKTNPTEGAGFFIVSKNKQKKEDILLKDVAVYGLTNNIKTNIESFLNINSESFDSIDMVLYSSSTSESEQIILHIFGANNCQDFTNWSGVYYTNSALALAFAMDKLKSGNNEQQVNTNYKILIVNNLMPQNLGLILISTDDR